MQATWGYLNVWSVPQLRHCAIDPFLAGLRVPLAPDHIYLRIEEDGTCN